MKYFYYRGKIFHCTYVKTLRDLIYSKLSKSFLTSYNIERVIYHSFSLKNIAVCIIRHLLGSINLLVSIFQMRSKSSLLRSWAQKVCSTKCSECKKVTDFYTFLTEFSKNFTLSRKLSFLSLFVVRSHSSEVYFTYWALIVTLFLFDVVQIFYKVQTAFCFSWHQNVRSDCGLNNYLLGY